MPLLRRTAPLLLLCTLALAACRVPPAAAPEKGWDRATTGTRGQVLDPQGRPAEGAYVYAYRNARNNLRGPADFEARAGTDGRYLLDLVAGRYYLVARLRRSGADVGPPRRGDAWALPSQNPVTIEPGEVATIDFRLQKIAQPMLMREGTLTSGDTGFTGTLLDRAGQPVAGAFVIAYPDRNFQRKPEATSPTVGADGRFTLYVARPGRWCLAARTRHRGQPVAGELYGVLGEGELGCRWIEADQVLEVGPLRLTPYQR